MFVKKDLAVRSVSRSLVGSLAAKAQHDEGRVLVIEFEHFVLLNTYAQNNGWSPESFAKRRRWDAEVDGEFFFNFRMGSFTDDVFFKQRSSDRSIRRTERLGRRFRTAP